MKTVILLIILVFSSSGFANHSSFNVFHNFFSDSYQHDNNTVGDFELFEQHFSDISDIFQGGMETILTDNPEVGLVQNTYAMKLAAATAAYTIVNIHISSIVSKLSDQFDEHLKSIRRKHPERTALYHFQSSAWFKLSKQLKPIIWNTFGFPILGEIIAKDADLLKLWEDHAQRSLKAIRGLKRSAGLKKSEAIQLAVLEAVNAHPQRLESYFKEVFLKAYYFLKEQSHTKKQLGDFLPIVDKRKIEACQAINSFNFLDDL